MIILPRSTAPRLAWLALAGGLACTDLGSRVTATGSAPGIAPAADTIAAAAGTVVVGRAVLSVRAHDARGVAARLLTADSGSYESSVAGAGAKELSGRVMLRSGALDLPLSVGANAARRQGEWERHASARAGRPDRTVRFTAVGGAPPSKVELRTGGDLVARVETVWRKNRSGDGWRVGDRTVTLFRDGSPARTIQLSLDEPSGTRARASSAGAEGPSYFISPDDPPDIDWPGFGGGGPDCQRELDALYDALDAYWAADSLMGLCIAGPLPCFGASVQLLYASLRVDAAQSRLDSCLRG